jgi:chromatin remodeling complex protein RSC6
MNLTMQTEEETSAPQLLDDAPADELEPSEEEAEQVTGHVYYRNQQRHKKIVKELLKIDVIYDEIAQQRKQMTGMMSQLKHSRERIVQLSTDMSDGSKAKGSGGRAGGGGLCKPFMVSPELCQFMAVPAGTMVARAEVTKYIHKYIQEKELFSTDNKQYIIPDANLSGLLDTEHNYPVHIFDIQQRMNPHFNYAKNAGPDDSSALSVLGA